MSWLKEIEEVTVLYKSIKSKEEFMKRLIVSCKLIAEKEKQHPKHIYDVLGRVYKYDKPEDLLNIQLEPEVLKLTKVVADMLM